MATRSNDIKKETSSRPLALVTGASSGIGYELAKQFAGNGFDLVVASEDDGIMEAASLFRQLGAHAEPVQVDLSTFRGVERLYETIADLGRPLDAAAINAGVGVSGDFARDTEIRDEIKMINLNITGAVHLSKLILQEMVANGKGRILLTSSIAAEMPGPFYAVYAATKAFLKSFGEALREELKDSGVTITVLQPGATDTAFFERAGMEDTKAGRSDKDDPADVARDGFEALMAGKDHVYAGSMMNAVQGFATRFMSESMKAKAQRRQSEPGSGMKN